MIIRLSTDLYGHIYAAPGYGQVLCRRGLRRWFDVPKEASTIWLSLSTRQKDGTYLMIPVHRIGWYIKILDPETQKRLGASEVYESFYKLLHKHGGYMSIYY